MQRIYPIIILLAIFATCSRGSVLDKLYLHPFKLFSAAAQQTAKSHSVHFVYLDHESNTFIGLLYSEDKAECIVSFFGKDITVKVSNNGSVVETTGLFSELVLHLDQLGNLIKPSQQSQRVVAGHSIRKESDDDLEIFLESDMGKFTIEWFGAAPPEIHGLKAMLLRSHSR